ncbi:MAG: mevalonate kinase [Chloroflexota bacterium]
MPAIATTVPGKIILVGEHAVVYGRPAIAVPVMQVQARAAITANPRAKPGTIRIQSANIGLETILDELSEEHPIRKTITSVADALHVDHIPACTIRLISTIPVASGLGSGAAIAVALIRSLSAFLGHPFSDDQVNALAFEIEKIHHLTPSGLDNTVITYAKPVYFIKDQPLETFQVGKPFLIAIGDTRISSPTALAVAEVHRSWKADKAFYERVFDSIGGIVIKARQAIESGDIELLGLLMNENHEWLRRINVSSPDLDHLVSVARMAGALGAKLSGGGRGGNMIALVTPENAERVAQALRTEGVMRTILTKIDSTRPLFE